MNNFGDQLSELFVFFVFFKKYGNLILRHFEIFYKYGNLSKFLYIFTFIFMGGRARVSGSIISGFFFSSFLVGTVFGSGFLA